MSALNQKDESDVKNWDDARLLLRTWRDENMRKSQDILEIWENIVCASINKFGDEKWLVLEQVCVAALDCHNILVASNCIAALRKQYPKSIRVRRLTAMKFEAMEQYEKALQKYGEILEDDETNAHAKKRIISCLKSQNKTKEYINELNDYLKLYQADHEAWLELCEAYLNEMEFAKASFCLEELIIMHPHNHVYFQRYADIKYTQGNYEVARNYYLYALKLNPNNARALYGILLVTSNLKINQKAKDPSSENSKLAAWSSKKISDLYKKNKCDEATTYQLTEMMKYLQV
jgi:tetratricopeptide (TPR) repeat protein